MKKGKDKVKTTKVSKNFQTYVPKAVREALEINDKSEIIWNIDKKGKVKIEKQESIVEWAKRTSGVAKDFADKYGSGIKQLEKDRAEWDKDRR